MDDSWDDALAARLRARPEFMAPGDLAAQAVRRAKAQEERRAGLQRLGRRVRLCSAAACVLVVGVVAISLIQWPSFSSSGTTAAASTADTSNAGALFTWGLVLAGFAGLVVWRLLWLRDDRMSHAM